MEQNNNGVKETKEYKYSKLKKRYWTFVLYPESAPQNWKELLQRTGLEIAISPLHNKDKNPTGEIKKAHYHIILCYNAPTTGNNVKSLVDNLNQPIPLPIDSVRGLYRYLTHKDNPEKYQYNEKEIQVLNGFNIRDYADLSSADKSAIKLELTKFIKESDIMEYSDFMDKVIELDKPDYFFIASTNTTYFNAYLISKRNKHKDKLESGKYKLLDTETGEIIER
ncbi:TPA: replication protein [Streptococcus agalactiae]|nr:replication protein [Streptococcus agalactiae]